MHHKKRGPSPSGEGPRFLFYFSLSAAFGKNANKRCHYRYPEEGKAFTHG